MYMIRLKKCTGKEALPLTDQKYKENRESLQQGGFILYIENRLQMCVVW
jgi:hypothetical protein